MCASSVLVSYSACSHICDPRPLSCFKGPCVISLQADRTFAPRCAGDTVRLVAETCMTRKSTGATSSLGVAAVGNLRMPTVKLQTSDGTVSEYQEWKREVLATATLDIIEDAQIAGFVFFALETGPGKPRGLRAHLEVPGDVCSDVGLNTIWHILDE